MTELVKKKELPELIEDILEKEAKLECLATLKICIQHCDDNKFKCEKECGQDDECLKECSRHYEECLKECIRNGANCFKYAIRELPFDREHPFEHFLYEG